LKNLSEVVVSIHSRRLEKRLIKPLGLLKLAAYHQQMGDSVSLVSGNTEEDAGV